MQKEQEHERSSNARRATMGNDTTRILGFLNGPS